MALEAGVGFTGKDLGLGRLLGDLKGQFTTWSRSIGGLVRGALGPLSTLTGVLDFGKDLIAGASDAIKVETQLNTVITQTGQAAGFTTDQLKEMADEMAKVVEFDDDAIKSSQALIAAFSNIKGDIFKGAVTGAQDLATALGMDLDTATRKLAKSLNDPIAGFDDLRLAGVEFSAAEEEVIKKMAEMGDVAGAQQKILDGLASRFGGAAANSAKTFGGFMVRMKNQVLDAVESIGMKLVPALEKLSPIADASIKIFSNLIDTFTSTDSTVGKFVDDTLNFLIDGLYKLVAIEVQVFSAGETLVKNWSTAMDLGFTSVLLGVETWSERTKFAFDVVGKYLTWLGENWKEIFTDMFAFQDTVITNMYKNLTDFFKSIWSWLKGEEVDWKWASLTEGFESSLKELPAIAERELSTTERVLQARIGELSQTLAGEFSENFAKNMDFIGFDAKTGRPKEAAKEEKKAASGGPGFLDQGLGAVFSGLGQIGKFADKAESAIKDGLVDAFKGQQDEQQDQEAGGIVGLTELFNKIQQSSAQDKAVQLQERTANATEQGVAIQIKAARAAEKTAEGVGKLLGQGLNFVSTFGK